MSRTKSAAMWFACGLFGVLTCGGLGRAGEKAIPATLTSVVFKGAEHFSAKELQQTTSLKPSAGMAFDAAKAAADCAALVRHYQEHGYPFVTCSQSLKVCVCWCFPVTAVNELVYTINEGPKVKVQRVEFVGNQFVGGDVLTEQLECHQRGASRTNFAAVQGDVIRLTEYYRSFGYLDVSVSYELQWNLDGGTAVMMFHINEGERYKQD